jgi:hypothetical protein
VAWENFDDGKQIVRSSESTMEICPFIWLTCTACKLFTFSWAHDTWSELSYIDVIRSIYVVQLILLVIDLHLQIYVPLTNLKLTYIENQIVPWLYWTIYILFSTYRQIRPRHWCLVRHKYTCCYHGFCHNACMFVDFFIEYTCHPNHVHYWVWSTWLDLKIQSNIFHICVFVVIKWMID